MLRIRKEVLEKLRILSEELSMSMSSIVTMLINNYIKNNKDT